MDPPSQYYIGNTDPGSIFHGVDILYDTGVKLGYGILFAFIDFDFFYRYIQKEYSCRDKSTFIITVYILFLINLW